MANYEDLKKSQLEELCDERDIKYTKKMVKSALVELLQQSDAHKTNIQKGGTKAGTKAGTKGGTKTKSDAPSTPKAESSSQSSIGSKIDLTKDFSSAPSQDKKSVILVVPLISQLIDEIDKHIVNENKKGAIEAAEQLKMIVDTYNFHSMDFLVLEIRKTIKSVVDAFSSPEAKRFIKTNYVSSPTNIKVCGRQTVTSRLGKNTITLEELKLEVENKEFIDNLARSIKDLLIYKNKRYTRLKSDLAKENTITEAKIKKLRDAGVRDRTIEDMYPCYTMSKAFQIDLEEVIDLVKQKMSDVNSENIKINLMEAINDSNHGLASVTGRLEIKNRIASQIYSFSKGYKTFVNSFNNIAIIGPAGSGKSFIAQVLAFVFSKIGILVKNNIKIVTKADLVGQYIGQTAPRTRAALIETLEGILFIDEAYQLTCQGQGSKDYGGESIAELINFIDKYIGLSIVIVAGYEKEMKGEFMKFNEGLPRRFPYIYTLKAYNNRQLTDILLTNLVEKLPSNFQIDENVSNFIFSLISDIRKSSPSCFKNQAGDMLNLSAALNQTIVSSYKIQWGSSWENNQKIIIEGFEIFLEPKNISLSSF